MRKKMTIRSGVAGALLAALAGLLAACGPAGLVSSGAAAGPIPWLDVSGSRLAVPSITAQRACTAADLQLSAGAAGAYRGQASQEVLIRNGASDACFLAGAPAGSLLLGDGSRRAVTVSSAAANRIDLAPGQTARLLIGTPALCAGVGHPVVGSSLRLAFDAGAPANVSGVWVNVECGSPAVLLFEAGPVPVTDVPASGLRASLSAPASVSGGSTLAYMVILSNPTSGAIAFGSCPSYTESLGGAARTLELNCAQVGSLAPGQSAAFEMKIGVPRSIGPGSAKLSWQLEVPDGTAAGVVLQVS